MTLADIKSQFAVWRGQYGKFLPKDKSAKIVDLGCGSGGMVYWLQSQGYEHAEGVDISREEISVGSNLGIKNLHHGDAISFLRGKENHYDAILLIDVLGFFPKEEVSEILRMTVSTLKPNGVVILRVSNIESPMGGRLRHGVQREEASFTEHGLKALLERSGASKVGAYPARPVVHGLVSFVRYCLWLIIEAFLKLYRLVESGTARGIFTQNMIVVGQK